MPLSLADIRHLDAAEGWLERGQYANCFHELVSRRIVASVGTHCGA